MSKRLTIAGGILGALVLWSHQPSTKMMTQGWLDLQKMPGESEPCRQLLSEECLEQWFVQGEPCKEVPEIPLDATWLWVNGSDPKWREKMQEQSRAEGIYSPEHHYR